MVPEIIGNVTPPVFVRPLAGDNTTVPATALTATFPKFISMVLEIAIGVMMVAEAVAIPETCPNVVERNPNNTTEITNNFFIAMLLMVV